MSDINLWIAIPTILAALVWVGVVVFYAIRAKWWKTPEGRNTEAVSAIMALLLVRLSFIHLLPDYVDHTVTGLLVYLAAAVVGIWRIGLIEKAQRGIRHWREWRKK